MSYFRIFQFPTLLLAGASAFSMSTLFSAMKPVLLTRYVEQAGFSESLAGLVVAMPFVGIALSSLLLNKLLGLMPLLYEGSNQAEFLKPTVVTLVFGLAFGMVLVLLVVPSVMAMQADVYRQVQSAKRALRGRRLAMFVPAGLGALGALALFALTVGPIVFTGAALPTVAAVLPMLNSGMGAAFGVFVVGLMALLLAIYIIALLGQGLRRTRG